MTVHVPTNLENFTPEWFTQVLGTSGTIENTSVTAIEGERIGDGQGFVGQVFRFELTYQTYREKAPKSIIAKISLPQNQREILIDLYRTEVNFYNKIANKTNIRIPQCYYAAFDETNGDSVILLEDLKKGRIGNSIAGCSSNQELENIADYLASLHATWWDKPKIESMDWVRTLSPLDNIKAKEKWQRKQNKTWERFAEKFEGQIPKPIEETWPIFVEYGDQIRKQALISPLTLCHGDFRLDNLFFGNPEDDHQLVVFDWQDLIQVQGPHDLSYFMIGNLTAEHRRAVESDLLLRYCDELQKLGVQNYSLEQCYHSYRVTLYDTIMFRLVTAGGRMKFPSKRSRTLFATGLERVSKAIIDFPISDLC